VTEGGKALVAGTDALRRTVELSAGALTHPTPVANPAPSRATDVFGLRYGPPGITKDAITVLTPQATLFTGSGGQFTGFTDYEPLTGAGRGKLLGYAGPRPGVRVIAQVQVGQGQVLRLGLPQWGSRLLRDPAAKVLMRQAWTLLSQ
jgi:hypothetical protein